MREKEQGHFGISLMFFLILVGLGVYGYFGSTSSIQLNTYEQQIFQGVHFIFSLFHMALMGVIALGILFLAVRFAVWIFRERQARKDFLIKRVHIAAPTLKPKKVEEFVKDFHKRNRVWYKRLLLGREWFGWLVYVNRENQIEFYVLYPRDKQNGVERTILDHFPGCELQTVKPEELPLPSKANKWYGGYFRLNNKGERAGLPLQPFSESQLGSILSHMAPQTWLFLRFSPEKSKVLEKRALLGLKTLGLTKHELETFFKLEIDQPHKTTSDLTPTEKARYKSLYQMYTGREKAFRVALAIWSEHPQAASVVQDVKSSVERVMEFDNFIFFRIARIFKTKQNPLQPLRILPWPCEQMEWAHSELSNLLHFPDAEDKIYEPPETGNRPYIQTIQDSIEDDDFSKGMYVGHLVDERGSPIRPIRIPYSTWTYMSFGSGKTGSGKTSLLLHLLYDHLDNVWYHDPDAPGATFIFPKKEDAYKLLAKINADLKRMEREGKDVSKLKERIHFFDLASDKYVLGLNLLHKNEWESVHEVVNNTLDLLKNAYKSESINLDNLGPIAIHTLLLDSKPHSILGIEQLLRKDSTFRNRILPRIKGTSLEIDWKEIKDDVKNKQTTQAVLNRLRKIRLNTRMKRIFGQVNMGLHPAKWMDEGHIVIFSCAGLSEEERKLVMGFIITQYHQQAQRRKRKSKIHLHICDEFHMVQIPIIKKIYAIDRYTGHCFVPMTQYAHQIQKDILEAFDGNVATYIACNQGSKSAEAMHEMSGKAIDADEVQHLEPLTAVISTVNKKGERVTFKVKTPPPYFYKENGQPAFYGPEVDKERHDREYNEAMAAAKRFAEELMQRDCTPAEEVDRWIDQYLSPKTVLEEMEEQQNEQQKQVEDPTDQKEEKNEPEDVFTPLF